eukprot:1554307-Rhodomonas_salina.2
MSVVQRVVPAVACRGPGMAIRYVSSGLWHCIGHVTQKHRARDEHRARDVGGRDRIEGGRDDKARRRVAV